MPPTYDDLMASAEEAQRKGGIVEAMGFYEKATKADPAKKQPWSRIAQAQFDARNYGSAITAAQEVLQRDTTDVTAKSIMAVSGLRVSANALEQLRLANALGGNTRDEAQTLARIMRDALGESILPPAAVTGNTTAVTAPRPATPPVRRVIPAPQANPIPATAPAAEPKRNPFDALKG
jgi:tetratricopeptide (TPR) repeat protein